MGFNLPIQGIIVYLNRKYIFYITLLIITWPDHDILSQQELHKTPPEPCLTSIIWEKKRRHQHCIRTTIEWYSCPLMKHAYRQYIKIYIKLYNSISRFGWDIKVKNRNFWCKIEWTEESNSKARRELKNTPANRNMGYHCYSDSYVRFTHLNW
jgi:hypothetical protein